MRVLRQPVARRIAVLVAGYVGWGALAWLLTVNQSPAGTSVYRENPGPVEAILGGLAGALVVATASVAWRAARHSHRVGVTAMVVAGLAGLVALAGMLTVGLFIMPIAAVLFFLASPIPPERHRPGAPPAPAPAGWYGDPGGSGGWRFWDGSAWTSRMAPGPTHPGIPGQSR